MQSEYTELVTIEELGDILMTSRTNVYRLLRSGELKAFKLGKVWKIPKVSVELYIKERSNL